ncbi:MAG TPA: hypothetical protein VHC96_02235 [Puia sp.]|jgi:hypothetical protein|nr:hypothetical protein [Puia sp.]
MKPNTVTATANSISSPLTALPTAKIVRHPQAKKLKDTTPLMSPPDEETVRRLNLLAKQYPFCIRHRGNNNHLL